MKNTAEMKLEQLDKVTGGSGLALAGAVKMIPERPIKLPKPVVRPGPDASFGKKIIIENMIVSDEEQALAAKPLINVF